MPTPSTYRFVAVENIATSQPPHFASARSATPSSFRRLRFLTASRFPHDLEMKPATLNDPEEGQPLLADPPTSRRTTPIPIPSPFFILLLLNNLLYISLSRTRRQRRHTRPPSQFEEIPSPGRGFQGSRALGGLAACKTLDRQASRGAVLTAAQRRLHCSISAANACIVLL